MDIVIREVRPDDDKMAISRVYEESWKHAYRGIVPQAYLDAIPEGKWARFLDIPGWNALVCEEIGNQSGESNIVGTSSYCAARQAEYEGWGEIISIYFRPAYMGKGYGTRLMQETLARLRAMGYTKVYLWVLEENVRARRFYEKMGFQSSGESMTGVIGGKELTEIQYIYQFED